MIKADQCCLSLIHSLQIELLMKFLLVQLDLEYFGEISFLQDLPRDNVTNGSVVGN